MPKTTFWEDRFVILWRDLKGKRLIVSIDESLLEEMEDFVLGKLIEEAEKIDDGNDMTVEEFLDRLKQLKDESNS